MTKTDDMIDLGPESFPAYGCTRCQKWHYEGDALFEPHIWHQSKHGIARKPATLVADIRAARQHLGDTS